ncbi:MAG: ParA family protein, partial [Pseudonocardiaceae bacterium]
MRTVAVLSLKGGVGKTSVVLGLAGAALQRKIRTLVVDLDPQGNCTAALDPDATKS